MQNHNNIDFAIGKSMFNHTFSQPLIKILTVLFFFIGNHLMAKNGTSMAAISSRLQKLNQYNGLSSAKITDILQDQLGFIWIATNNGINRYDSRTIKNYHLGSKANNPNANMINCLYQCRDGSIYAATQAGVWRYDLDQDKFIPEELSLLTGEDETAFYSITEDQHGTLYVNTKLGIIKKEGGKYDFFESADERLANQLSLVTFDQEGTMWIAINNEGIFYKKKNTQALKPFKPSNETEYTNIIFKSIQEMILGPNGTLWVATWGDGLWNIDTEKGTLQGYRHNPNEKNSPNSDNIKSIAFDPMGRLWIGYEEAGLDYFIPETQTFHHFYHPISSQSKFEEPSIYKIYIGEDLTMWLGFRNDGVMAYSLADNPFQLYTNPMDRSNYQVYCLFETPDKKLLGGTKGAIDILNPETNHFTRVELPNGETPVSICHLTDDESLVATFNDHIYTFNHKKQIFKNHPLPQPIDPTKPIVQLRSVYHPKGQDFFFVGSSRGFYKIPFQADEKVFPLTNNWIHSIIKEDNDSLYWLAAYNGNFTKLNINTLEQKNYQIDITPDTKAFAKHQDVLFLGTDHGLYKVDLKNNTQSKFTDIFPYPNLQINGIVKDNNTGLWCSSFESIIHYDWLNDQFRTYDKSDQLPEIRFHDGAAAKLSSGGIAFGGQGGILIVSPQKLKTQKNNTNLLLTSLKIHNKTMFPGEKDSPLKSNIATTNHLKLKNHQNQVTLEFSLLSYTNPSKHHFMYKLEGITDEWIDLGNQHQISFNNLKTGEYQLLIKAANQDNQWSNTRAINLEVLPPYYMTTYAFFVYAIILGALTVLFFKAYKARLKALHELQTNELKLKNLQKLSSQENEFHQLKHNFFTNISHELKTPLTLIMAPLEKSLNTGENPDKEILEMMQRNAERMFRLVSQILDYRKTESGRLKLELNKGDFTNYCLKKAKLFQPLAQKKGLQYHINIPDQPKLMWFDVDKMEKIIYNLLSNAFKFTQQGSVSFTVTYNTQSTTREDNFVSIVVTDTGKGISDEESKKLFQRYFSTGEDNQSIYENGSGIGLALTKELISIHQGELSYHSEIGEGTKFSVKIPSNLHPENQEPESPDTLLLEKTTKKHTPKQQEKEEKPRLLIVDDDEELREYIKKEFESEFSILLAKDGLEGLAIAKEELPDLIVSDLSMPGLNGEEMCSMLRENSFTCHIPIIVLSAEDSSTAMVKSFQTGIDDYMTKPFSPEILLLKIKNTLQTRKELHEKFSRDALLEPTKLAVTNSDEAFLNKVMDIIQENLTNEDFSADYFAEKMNMSRVHLYRKLKTLTGESVSEFVKTVRLKVAADLIRNKKISIKETTYMVGFSDPRYFTKCFKQHFGVKPTDYAKSED